MEFVLKFKDGKSIVLKNDSEGMIKKFIEDSLEEGKFKMAPLSDGETIVHSTQNLESISISVK